MNIVPLLSSGTPCPLTGTLHLPRMYTKIAADGKGVLAEGYPAIGKGFDQMVITALGLTPEKVTEAAKGRAYPAFVEELRLQGANFDAENVAALNRSILGYNHDDGTRGGILGAEGITDKTGIKSAVELNMLDDLRELFNALNPAPAEAAPAAPTVEQTPVAA